MNLVRLRAVFGINIRNIVASQTRAQAMHDGLAADPVAYVKPTLPLPAFQTLIVNLGTAHQAVKTRVIGARAKRDVQHALLLTGMEIERTFVQSLADANTALAEALITNGGLVVAMSPLHSKALLTLRRAKQSGGVICDANVGLLVGPGAKHPSETRYFNWQYTLDGGKSFVTVLSTTRGKTLIQGLTPLTTVGVCVSMTNSEGPAEWSQVVTILVL